MRGPAEQQCGGLYQHMRPGALEHMVIRCVSVDHNGGMRG